MEYKVIIISLIILFYGCVPPPYEPEKSEISTNDHWENTGKIVASFISSARTLGINTNTGHLLLMFLSSHLRVILIVYRGVFPEEKQMIL